MLRKRLFTLLMALFGFALLVGIGCGGSECDKDAACGEGKICVQGKCKDKPSDNTGCKEDKDCKAPKAKCDTANKKCVECLKNEDCGDGKECVDNACKAKSTEGCKQDSDCKSDEKCDAGKCVKKETGCKQDSDCKSDEKCDAGKCVKKATGCKQDSDCKDAGKSKCDTNSGQCVECLADSDCKDATKNKCVNNVCKAGSSGGGCKNCKADEFCFAKEKCLRKPKSCKTSKDCASDETCVRVSSSKNLCLMNCNPSKNAGKTDKHNPGCWSNYGLCYSLGSATKGVCVPPSKKILDKGATCGDITKPESDDFHDCKDPYLCASHKCVEPTQTEGQECNSSDKVCKKGLTCLIFSRTKKISLCKKDCDPKGANTCAQGFICTPISRQDPHRGACIEERKETRQKGESCEGLDPRDPSWNKCAHSAPCVKNVCAEPRKQSRQKGESCEMSDVTNPGYHTCVSGLRCHSHICKTACDPTAGNSTCAATEKCVAPSSSKPKEGVCQSLQGLECSDKKPCPSPYFCFKFNYIYNCVKPCDPTASSSGCGKNYTCRPFDIKNPKKGYCIKDRLHTRKKGEYCAFSNPANDSYNLCKKPLVCISLRCVDPPPATGKEGDECDSKKGCKAPLVCTRNDTGKDVCARFCNPYKANQCKQGEACVMKQKEKFYWQGGCFKARTKTQAIGDRCRQGDPTSPEYNDCVANAICIQGWCRQECKPGSSGSCPSTHECKKFSKTGYCSLKVQKIRKDKEECLGTNEKDPSYHDCAQGLSCLTFDRNTGLKLCMPNCDPKAAKPGCASDRECLGISSRDPHKGACIPKTQKTRKKGETCGDSDPRKPGWNDCVKGLGCGNGKCITPTQKQGQACSYEKALLCVDPLICVGTGSASWCLDKCDPKAPKCSTKYKCVGLRSGGGVCVQTCTSDADCSYGKCKDLGSSLGKLCI